MRPSQRRRPVNGTAIAQAREASGLTRVEIAKRAAAAGYAVDDSNLSKIEKGLLRYPTLETRLGLTAVLGITDEQMHAPCAVHGGEWSAACLKHRGSRKATAPEPAGRVA